jgi:hypothetical protein
MHILESYSLNCGAKIDKPFVYKNFFPIPFEKFIIFAPNAKSPSKEYNYFQDVIDMIFPILEKENIKILQVGPKNNTIYNKIINICGQASVNQISYLISNSMLIFGNDGLEFHIAGAENVPAVSINSITYKENTGSYFGNKNIQKVFESFKNVGNGKASFNSQENPKSINSIKPEQIANAIFELLKINFKIPFETVFCGQKYGNHRIQEVIPNHKSILFHPETLVEIKVDHEYDEESFDFQLSNYKKVILITDKEINLNILEKFKSHINLIVFKITKNNNIKFLEKARGIGLNIHLVSEMNEEDLKKEKINYYEFGSINKISPNHQEKVEELKKDLNKLYYKSSKITSSNNKMYYSLAAKNKDFPLENTVEYQKVIDSPEFWENIEFYTIVKINT